MQNSQSRQCKYSFLTKPLFLKRNWTTGRSAERKKRQRRARQSSQNKSQNSLSLDSLRIGTAKRQISMQTFHPNACCMVLISEIDIPELFMSTYKTCPLIICHQVCVQFSGNNPAASYYRNLSNVICFKVDLKRGKLVPAGAHTNFFYVSNCERKCRIFLVLFSPDLLESWKKFPTVVNMENSLVYDEITEGLHGTRLYQVLQCDFFPCPLLRNESKSIQLSLLGSNIEFNAATCSKWSHESVKII